MKKMSSNPGGSEGIVLEIQRMSTEDGPGIRTTVFMKGCSLKCAWCHNPESISFKPRIQWIKTNCIGCGICIDLCRESALSFHNKDIYIDREKCTNCGNCSDECPSGAIEIIGSKWTEDKLVEEILKDRAYFEKSSGGITISGGEPGLQADFVSLLLQRLKSEGVNTASGLVGDGVAYVHHHRPFRGGDLWPGLDECATLLRPGSQCFADARLCIEFLQYRFCGQVAGGERGDEVPAWADRHRHSGYAGPRCGHLSGSIHR